MRWKRQKKNVKRLIVLENALIPVTFLIFRRDDEYTESLRIALEQAGLEAGYEVNTIDSKNSLEIQLNQIKAASDNGQKIILISMVNGNYADRVLEAAGDMKVVLVNRSPSDMSLLNENAVYVGSNNTIAGRYQGEWLADYFNSINQKDIKYILLEGTPGLPTTVQRTEAALNALSEGGINATPAYPPINANYLRSEALYKIFPVLSSGIEFDTIISNNDAMALGAIAALEDLNMDPSQTPIVGVDATYPAVQALLRGDLAMTVFQNSKAQGYTAIAVMNNMLNGYPIDRGTDYKVSEDNHYVIYIPFEPVTANNFPLDLEYVILI